MDNESILHLRPDLLQEQHYVMLKIGVIIFPFDSNFELLDVSECMTEIPNLKTFDVKKWIRYHLSPRVKHIWQTGKVWHGKCASFFTSSILDLKDPPPYVVGKSNFGNMFLYGIFPDSLTKMK